MWMDSCSLACSRLSAQRRVWGLGGAHQYLAYSCSCCSCVGRPRLLLRLPLDGRLCHFQLGADSSTAAMTIVCCLCIPLGWVPMNRMAQWGQIFNFYETAQFFQSVVQYLIAFFLFVLSSFLIVWLVVRNYHALISDTPSFPLFLHVDFL